MNMETGHKVNNDNQIEVITDWWEEEVRCIYIHEKGNR